MGPTTGLAALALVLLTPLAAAERVLPADVAVDVRTYGAVGDGVHDDTAAIRAALEGTRNGYNPAPDYYYARPRTVYFPAGTYLVSDTITWTGVAMHLQGQGPTATVFRLKDGASGFGAGARKPVFTMQGGNYSFRMNFWDLAIDTGSGNPGAVGIDWICNNVGSLRNVAIRSGDGQGAVGVDMTRQWPGPCLVKSVQIHGFAVGIDIAQAEFGPTLEDLVLSGQSVAGLRNAGNTLAIRNLVSANSVPAIAQSGGSSLLILAGVTCLGGDGARSAVEFSAGRVYARELKAVGYQSALKQGATVVAGLSQAEWLSHPSETRALWPLAGSGEAAAPTGALKLPIRETPWRFETDPAQWQKVTAAPYGSGNQQRTHWQTALNAGKATVYTSAGTYFIGGGMVTVPAGVKQICGFGSIMNTWDSFALTLDVAEDSADPLIIEGFGYGVTINHRCSRTVVLKQGQYDYLPVSGVGTLGDVHFEDVGTDQVRLLPGQKAWARQLNIEGGQLHIDNQGADLVVMGHKSEGKGTIIHTRAGGRTDFLGTLLYPTDSFAAGDPPAFIIEDSLASLIYAGSSYVANGMYPVQVRETRSGVTRDLPVSALSGLRMPLYVGYATAQAPTANGGAPSITSGPSASPATVTTRSTTLSVAASDDGGAGRLVVTWSAAAGAPGQVVFEPNGCVAAATTIATFTRAGSHPLSVVVRDEYGAVATGSVTVTVQAVPGAVTVTPAAATVAPGATRAFAATVSGNDQFGRALAGVAPAVTWTVTGGGTISGAGIFTAGGSAGGPWEVRATAAGVRGTADVTVAASGAPVITSAQQIDAAPNSAFTYTITATNAPTAYTALDLPAGFSRSGATITGTVTGGGPIVFTVGATNAVGTGLAPVRIDVVTASGGGGTGAGGGGGGGGCGGGLASGMALLVLLAAARWRRGG